MPFVEENEISIKSKGGTEITKRTLSKYVPEELTTEFQVIPSRVRELQNDKIRIYWQHDLPEDPEVNHLKDPVSREKFHKLVFSSNWQLQEFALKLCIPQDEKIAVIETPVEPLNLKPKSKDVVNLIYFSTPHRGLQLLVPVFEEIAKKYDNVHLNVFSSFKIYGWEESDQQFQPLYDRIINHPKMTYHGFVEPEVLKEHIENSHILAYPCIWKETSCRVLIESMSAGLLCVHPNLAALPDTSGGLTSMYQFYEDHNKHANLFHQVLVNAIENINDEDVQKYLGFVKIYTDSRFNINKISTQWKNLLLELKNRYPTEESRKIVEQMFIYRT
jgi:UDP-glucose:(glucosyl)LPS alpha-1,2-glucosyltransferase